MQASKSRTFLFLTFSPVELELLSLHAQSSIPAFPSTAPSPAFSLASELPLSTAPSSSLTQGRRPNPRSLHPCTLFTQEALPALLLPLPNTRASQLCHVNPKCRAPAYLRSLPFSLCRAHNKEHHPTLQPLFPSLLSPCSPFLQLGRASLAFLPPPLPSKKPKFPLSTSSLLVFPAAIKPLHFSSQISYQASFPPANFIVPNSTSPQLSPFSLNRALSLFSHHLQQVPILFEFSQFSLSFSSIFFPLPFSSTRTHTKNRLQLQPLLPLLALLTVSMEQAHPKSPYIQAPPLSSKLSNHRRSLSLLLKSPELTSE